MANDTLPKEEYLFQEVPGVLVSDYALEPDAQLRPTQTNIGHYMLKKEELSFGFHQSEYSGIGRHKLHDEKGRLDTVGRSHHHLRTALHKYPHELASEEALQEELKANVGLFTEDINKIGDRLFKLSRSYDSEPLPQLVEKQLFPRSILYELAYTKAVNKKTMLEALEKERAVFEKATKDNISKAQDTSSKDERLPLKEAITSNPIPEKVKIVKKMPEKPSTEKCTSTCEPCGCTLIQGVCPLCHKSEPKLYKVASKTISGWKDGEQCKEWPNEVPRYGSSWGEQRKAELLRVGYPFAKEAADWLYCTIKPLDCSQLYRASKKRFLERSFSSLNI